MRREIAPPLPNARCRSKTTIIGAWAVAYADRVRMRLTWGTWPKEPSHPALLQQGAPRHQTVSIAPRNRGAAHKHALARPASQTGDQARCHASTLRPVFRAPPASCKPNSTAQHGTRATPHGLRSLCSTANPAQSIVRDPASLTDVAPQCRGPRSTTLVAHPSPGHNGSYRRPSPRPLSALPLPRYPALPSHSLSRSPPFPPALSSLAPSLAQCSSRW